MKFYDRRGLIVHSVPPPDTWEDWPKDGDTRELADGSIYEWNGHFFKQVN